MKFAIAVHGTRGDVEPAAAVALELRRRGHDVRMAVPPNLVRFTESAGLSPVDHYGPDSHKQMEAEVVRKWWSLRNPVTVVRQAREFVTEGWAEMGETVMRLAEGADVVISGTTYQELVSNVAEARGLPFAALHTLPIRANTHLLPVRLPLGSVKQLWAAAEWAHWRLLKPADDAQRHSLGLPASRTHAVRRIVEAGALEIQTYDKTFFPGLEEEWRGGRPIVGGMTLGLATTDDPAIASWIGGGRPPIYFGLGSTPIEDPAGFLKMIVSLCRELGERGLVCAGAMDFARDAGSEDVLVVPSVNYAEVFPRCRAIVHHGGAGTTAASVRAGVPNIVLWVCADQPLWGRQVRRLGIGTSRRLSATTRETLREDLRKVLSPKCVARAREVAGQMTSPRQSVSAAADLLERLGDRRTS